MTPVCFDRLAHLARCKLQREASRPVHRLRQLVLHANTLDALILGMCDTEEDQDKYFNQVFSLENRSTIENLKKVENGGSVHWAELPMKRDEKMGGDSGGLQLEADCLGESECWSDDDEDEDSGAENGCGNIVGDQRNEVNDGETGTKVCLGPLVIHLTSPSKSPVPVTVLEVGLEVEREVWLEDSNSPVPSRGIGVACTIADSPLNVSNAYENLPAIFSELESQILEYQTDEYYPLTRTISRSAQTLEPTKTFRDMPIVSETFSQQPSVAV